VSKIESFSFSTDLFREMLSNYEVDVIARGIVFIVQY